MSRLERVLAVGAVVAVLAVVGTAVAKLGREPPAQAGGAGRSASPVSPTPSTVATSVVATSPLSSHATPVPTVIKNTWDSDRSRLVGVYAYPVPTNAQGHLAKTYLEGDIVQSVCQERQGQMVTDTPYKDRPLSWPVWDKLSTGEWIPDMYTDLPKEPGSSPARGLPRCG